MTHWDQLREQAETADDVLEILPSPEIRDARIDINRGFWIVASVSDGQGPRLECWFQDQKTAEQYACKLSRERIDGHFVVLAPHSRYSAIVNVERSKLRRSW